MCNMLWQSPSIIQRHSRGLPNMCNMSNLAILNVVGMEMF